MHNKFKGKIRKEAQNMKNDKTLARVERERERERATTLTNNNKAKKLALFSILRTGTKHENVQVTCPFFVVQKNQKVFSTTR